jgi:hypothetical protein
MFSIELEDKPLFNKAAYDKQYRKTDKAKATKRRTRKPITDAKWLSRRFVAVDGEGINVRHGAHRGEHLYIMFAISGVPPIIDEKGLSTEAILNYLWQSIKPTDIAVIYGGSYDFNMWIKDLTEDEVRHLYKSSYTSTPVIHRGYGLRWIKGKAFEISRTDEAGNKRTITINDVISFFQRPFIQACDEYLGEYEGREELVREKAKRGNFKLAEVVAISHYNQLELVLLIQLMNELRLRLNKVGLRPRRWNSPGAIASALFSREKIKQHRNENLPDAVAEAGRYAYAGGRFELIKYGSVKERVYEYDINSAYPAALREVPSLQGGNWLHHEQHFDKVHSLFSVWRVRFRGDNARIPAPIFVRGENGTIAYPLKSENWIWNPEYRALQDYCSVVPNAEYETVECWEYVPTTPVKPFAFITALFEKRRALKAAGDGAHVGIKLGLNSLYGKLAQQVGWLPATSKHPLRVPTYHQLEWAGYATSWCRAQVLKAALLDIDSVIAFETDALFTTRPLIGIDTGSGLGQWEETVFKSLTYVQSGHYYATQADGKQVIKCRGIDKGFISRKAVERLLGNPESTRVLSAKLTRFYGAGIALARGLDKYWRKWLSEPKQLQLRPTGKRVHGACWCDTAGGLVINEWHNTYCPVTGGVSHEYPVDWINPNPAMTELSEFRESENFYED